MRTNLKRTETGQIQINRPDKAAGWKLNPTQVSILLRKDVEKCIIQIHGTPYVYEEPMSDVYVDDIQMNPDNADELTEDINAQEGGGGGGITIPDYANIETINRLPTVTSTWTSDRDGYISLLFYSNGIGSIVFSVNGATVLQSGYHTGPEGTASIAPIKKGDTVSITATGDIPTATTTTVCYFIPPIIIEESPVSVNAIGPPDYANMTASKGVTWTVDADGYVVVWGDEAAQNDCEVYVTVNGKEIIHIDDQRLVSGNLRVDLPLQVSKGDIISGTNVRAIYFIPPKSASIFFKHVNFAFDTGVIGTAMQNEDTKEIAITGEYGYCEGDGNRYLLSRPDTWPVNAEINFLGSLYGKRYTGTISQEAASQNVTVLDSFDPSWIIMNCSGSFKVADVFVGMESINRTNGANNPTQWSSVWKHLNNQTVEFRSYCGDLRTNAPYDIWITYTK
jgi:hypothetical protein